MQTASGTLFFISFAGMYYLVTVAVNILSPSGVGGQLENIKVLPTRQDGSSPPPPPINFYRHLLCPCPGNHSSLIILKEQVNPAYPTSLLQYLMPGPVPKLTHRSTEYPLSLELPSGLFPVTVMTVNRDSSATAL